MLSPGPPASNPKRPLEGNTEHNGVDGDSDSQPAQVRGGPAFKPKRRRIVGPEPPGLDGRCDARSAQSSTKGETASILQRLQELLIVLDDDPKRQLRAQVKTRTSERFSSHRREC